MAIPRRIEDYAVVTLITLLLWLFAEAQNVQTYVPPAAVSIAFATSSKDLAVVGQSVSRVTLEFRGAQSEVDKLRSRMTEGLKVTLDSAEPGKQTYSLSKLLASSAPISDVSASITRIEPETVELTVVRLVTKEAELVFKPEGVKLLDDVYKVTPARISITLPEDKLAAITGESGKIALPVAPPASVNLAALRSGVEHNVRADAVLPAALAGDANVKLSQRSVDLSFTIDRKDASIVLPSVPVWPSVPAEELKNFSVKFDDAFLKDVKVSGPRELVRQVEKGEAKVLAIVTLGREDLVRGVEKETMRTVKFIAPEGLTIESADTSVNVTITKLTP